MFKRLLNSIHVVLFVYVLSLILSTFLFSYFEHKPLLDSFYWSCVTALTIGYGDISPQTDVMRLLGVLLAHFWILFIMPLIIGHMIVRIVEDKNEFTDFEQEEIKQLLKTIHQNTSKQKDFI